MSLPRKPHHKGFKPRTSGLRRTGFKRRSNPMRRRTEFARAYGSDARVRWIKAMNCFACGRRGCENAHLESGGMGRKADADTIVNLCPPCHAESHRVGLAAFAEAKGLTVQDFYDRAAALDAAWRGRA